MVNSIGTKGVNGVCIFVYVLVLCFKTAESWAKILPVNIFKPQVVAATVCSKVLILLFSSWAVVRLKFHFRTLGPRLIHLCKTKPLKEHLQIV